MFAISVLKDLENRLANQDQVTLSIIYPTMKKLSVLLIVLTCTCTLAAQVKPSLDFLQADRTQPLQKEDISPFNTILKPNTSTHLRFNAGATRSFQPLPVPTPLTTQRDGLRFFRSPDTHLIYLIKGTPFSLNKYCCSRGSIPAIFIYSRRRSTNRKSTKGTHRHA